jgi:hypothetical protein
MRGFRHRLTQNFTDGIFWILPVQICVNLSANLSRRSAFAKVEAASATADLRLPSFFGLFFWFESLGIAWNCHGNNIAATDRD